MSRAAGAAALPEPGAASAPRSTGTGVTGICASIPPASAVRRSSASRSPAARSPPTAGPARFRHRRTLGRVDATGSTPSINALIAEDHPVCERWISDAELAANPGLVRTMSVKPPTGTGQVRLVSIGEGGSIDLQPCGGTHVRRTGEIGRVAVGKLESKGKQNRRIRLTFA